MFLKISWKQRKGIRLAYFQWLRGPVRFPNPKTVQISDIFHQMLKCFLPKIRLLYGGKWLNCYNYKKELTQWGRWWSWRKGWPRCRPPERRPPPPAPSAAWSTGSAWARSSPAPCRSPRPASARSWTHHDVTASWLERETNGRRAVRRRLPPIGWQHFVDNMWNKKCGGALILQKTWGKPVPGSNAASLTVILGCFRSIVKYRTKSQWT